MCLSFVAFQHPHRFGKQGILESAMDAPARGSGSLFLVYAWAESIEGPRQGAARLTRNI
jgi:hypothetical protein